MWRLMDRSRKVTQLVRGENSHLILWKLFIDDLDFSLLEELVVGSLSGIHTPQTLSI